MFLRGCNLKVFAASDVIAKSDSLAFDFDLQKSEKNLLKSQTQEAMQLAKEKETEKHLETHTFIIDVMNFI